MTIYDELGGRVVVEFVVDLFYRKILGDPLLAPRFADVDLAALMRRQCLFMAFATGRVERYEGASIRAVHAPLSLGNHDFDRVAGHLAAALADVGAPGTLIARVMAVVETTRADVAVHPSA